MPDKIVVADADALIALILETDVHHLKAVEISTNLESRGVEVIFPATVFPEAMTSLARAINQPHKAQLINQQLMEGLFQVECPNADIFQKASQIFAQTKSKKNTYFDAIVAATAMKLKTKTIFSFDSWYKKLGFYQAH